jgi:hypothetical protein
VKWYRKVAVELILGTAVVNFRFIYNNITGKSITLLQFRESVVDELLNTEIEDNNNEEPTRSIVSSIRHHVFTKFPGSSRVGAENIAEDVMRRKEKIKFRKTRLKKLLHIVCSRLP